MGSNIPYDGEKDCTGSEYRGGALHCVGGGDVKRERKDSEVVGELWAGSVRLERMYNGRKEGGLGDEGSECR